MSEIDTYFYNKPEINYSNNNVKNIFFRIVASEELKGNPYLYYNYNIKQKERPDQIAERYYEDPYKEWILYLVNGITDPYYDWFLDDETLNSILIKKYGSVENSINKVKYYRNNWYDYPETITTNEYNSLANFKKYDPVSNNYIWQSNKRFYEPATINKSNVVTSYKRREIEWTKNTNKTIRYNITGNSNFTVDEIVTIYIDASNSGRGQVVTSNSSTVTIQHVFDVVTSNSTLAFTANSYVYGRESTSNCVITSNTVLTEDITVYDALLWSPVTYYDYETEKNKKNENIKVLDAKATDEFIQGYREIIRNV